MGSNASLRSATDEPADNNCATNVHIVGERKTNGSVANHYCAVEEKHAIEMNLFVYSRFQSRNIYYM